MAQKKLKANTPKTRRGKVTKKVLENVKQDLAHTGNLEAAAANNGVSASTIHRHLQKDPELKEEFDMARGVACQRLEREAFRRAVEGTDREVYFEGQVVGTYKEYSDVLLRDLLKANMPTRYSNKTEVQVNHEHDLSGGVKEKLASLLQISDQSDNSGDIIDADYVEEDSDES